MPPEERAEWARTRRLRWSPPRARGSVRRRLGLRGLRTSGSLNRRRRGPHRALDRARERVGRVARRHRRQPDSLCSQAPGSNRGRGALAHRPSRGSDDVLHRRSSAIARSSGEQTTDEDPRDTYGRQREKVRIHGAPPPAISRDESLYSDSRVYTNSGNRGSPTTLPPRRCPGTWWAPPPSKRVGRALPVRRVRFPSTSATAHVARTELAVTPPRGRAPPCHSRGGAASTSRAPRSGGCAHA